MKNNNELKKIIEAYIRDFAADYMKRCDIKTVWGEPIVGFADAYHPSVQNLKEQVSSGHVLPQDVMANAKIIIAYFVPFTREMAKTNRKTGKIAADTGWELASGEWACAYEETNAMFTELNEGIIKLLAEFGYKGIVPAQAAAFDKKHLVSDWSQRHLAYAAGLGTFGINNMLITAKGCCGRFNTVVSDLDLDPDRPVNESGNPDDEYCLYKKNGTCGACVKNCPTGAISLVTDNDGKKHLEFNRNICYEMCLKNAAIYKNFGNSYNNEEAAEAAGSEVCGKCITASPCAFR